MRIVKFVFSPQTRLGKWSAGMFVAFMALLAAGALISALQVNTIEYPNTVNDPILAVDIYLMFAAAIAAAICGLIAVMKKGERSISVFLSIPLGLMYLVGVVILLIGLIIGPPALK